MKETTTAALKLALEALEWFTTAEQGNEPPINKAITAIKEALAQDEKGLFIDLIAQHEGLSEELAQAEHEQALLDAIVGGTGVMLGDKRIDPASIYKQRPWGKPWVSLTDEEIEEAYAKPTLRKMYQAIEAKLKELNT